MGESERDAVGEGGEEDTGIERRWGRDRKKEIQVGRDRGRDRMVERGGRNMWVFIVD